MEGADFAPVNREVEAIRKGLSANYECLDSLKDMSFSPVAALASPGYAALWATPLVGLVASLLIKLLTHTSPEKVAAKRQRQACSKALGQLKRIAATNTKQQNELLVSIMQQFIGDRFDKTARSLTPDDCYDAIIDATEDTRRADKFRQTMKEFEAGRYASIETDLNPERVKEVIRLVRDIEKAAHSAKRSRNGHPKK